MGHQRHEIKTALKGIQRYIRQLRAKSHLVKPKDNQEIPRRVLVPSQPIENKITLLNNQKQQIKRNQRSGLIQFKHLKYQLEN